MKKKKASKKEIKDLRNIVVKIQRDPVAMMQIKKLIAQTT